MQKPSQFNAFIVSIVSTSWVTDILFVIVAKSSFFYILKPSLYCTITNIRGVRLVDFNIFM